MNCRTSLMSALFGLALFGAAFTSNSAFAADADGDGVDSSTDCNDADASVKGPGTWYADGDGDGYGDDAVNTASCQQPVGYVNRGGDCNVSDPSIFPTAPEVVGDGVDQDCLNGDLILPVTEQVFARFAAAEYGGQRPTAEIFTAEYGACQAAGSTVCVIDMAQARFVILDETKVFADIYRNGTQVLHCGRDGREVVDKAAESHAPRCNSRSGGLGQSTVIRLADERIAEALSTYDEGIQAQFTALNGEVGKLKEQVEGIGRLAAENQGNIAANGEAIARNTAAVSGLQTWRAGVDQTNARQDREIQTALSQGLSLHFVPAYRYMHVDRIAGTLDEETLVFRKDNHSFAGVGGRVAYTMPSFSFYFGGEMGWGGDGLGNVPDSLLLGTIGGMYHFAQVPGLSVGGLVAGGRLSSNVNILQYSARAGVVIGEAELGYDIANVSNFDGGFSVFAGFGRDNYGVYGVEDGEETVFSGSGSIQTIGIRAFIGAGPSEARRD